MPDMDRLQTSAAMRAEAIAEGDFILMDPVNSGDNFILARVNDVRTIGDDVEMSTSVGVITTSIGNLVINLGTQFTIA